MCDGRVTISAQRIERYLIAQALERAEADVLPDDPAIARKLLRKTLGCVTVHAVKRMKRGSVTTRRTAPGDRVQVHWPDD
jgi:hypothetical protein